MTKEQTIKELTNIKGIGKAKAELLIKKGFDSIDKIKKASIDDLIKIDGITETLAKDINNHFKEDKQEKPEKTKTPKQKEVKKPEATPKEETEKTPAPKKPTKQKETKEEKKKEKVEKIKEEEEIKEEEYKVKKKPKLSNEKIAQLRLRKQIKNRTPDFLREEWFRYKRISKNWRRPDGITSKMRRNFKYRPNKVRIGYRGPKETRGLHPSGFKEVIVSNVGDLEGVDPKIEAVRISSTVGTKKRIDIEKKAEELEVRILNV
jgi:large subunit ribosomal protein L32e